MAKIVLLIPPGRGPIVSRTHVSRWLCKLFVVTVVCHLMVILRHFYLQVVATEVETIVSPVFTCVR